MNTTNKFFKTKEQHIKFRKAFASAVKDPRNKKSKPNANGYRKRGWITGAHIMLQNLIRGLPIDRGFTPITKQIRLDNGANPNEAVNYSKWYLQHYINTAKEFVKAAPAQLGSWELPKQTKSLMDVFKFPSTKEIEATECKKACQILIVAKTANRQEQYKKKVNEFLESFGDSFTIHDLAQVEIKEDKNEE